MANNKKLGRHLSDIVKDYSLLDEIIQLEQSPTDKQIKISLDLIDLNPFQPRKVFNQDRLKELADSIAIHGVFTPILVRRKNDRYQLISGERRFRASKIANMTDIPAIITNFDDQEMLEIALIENIQRENLNIIEEARGYLAMIEQLGYNHQIIARRVGKSRPYITNIIRVLSLPEQIQEDVLEGNLTIGQVKPLVGLNKNDILELSSRIKKERLSSRKIESIVKYHYRNDNYLSWQKALAKMLKPYQATLTFTKTSLKITCKNEKELETIVTKMLVATKKEK